MGNTGFRGVGGSGSSGGLGAGPQQVFNGLLWRYARRGFLRIVSVDVNVADVIASTIEVGQLIHVMRYMRVRRRTHKLLFVRRVNRYSMRAHGRPAYSWLRYGRNIEDEWVNQSVGLVKKLAQKADAVVVEDLEPRGLKARLRSKDPSLAMLLSTWPVAKILRRLHGMADKLGRLVVIPPHYTSSLCPRCNTLMNHERGRWDRLACPRCGHRDDRDHVAVYNIARTALLINGFHHLDTHLGRQIREYKQALDSLTTAVGKVLAQGPEKQGLPLGGKGEDTLPKYPEARPPRGLLGRGCLMNLSPMEGGRSQPTPGPSTLAGVVDRQAVGRLGLFGKAVGGGWADVVDVDDQPLTFSLFSLSTFL
jgi:IS605 OrfB family transposase